MNLVFDNRRKIFWAKTVIHIMVLFMIFIGPELVFSIGRNIPTIMLLTPMCYIILFYINYYWITDRFIFTQKNIGLYILINIILTIVIISIFYIVESAPRPPIHLDGAIPPPPKPDGILPPNIDSKDLPSHTLRALTMVPRIGTMALLSICLSLIVKSIERWIRIERQHQKMKSELQEKELKNLKNQLNPHFLFNTLNNIYALIPISQEKAQKTVHELSQLLRYSLYSNDDREVPLEKELLFIKNYISLMKLRINEFTSINVNLNENDGKGKLIAPMLLITLVENAFKHGIGGNKHSFIRIDISIKDNILDCHVENSFYPKNENDKSGSGIGISNLRRQLEILYPEQHSLSNKIVDNSYIPHLTIHLT